MTLLVQSDSPFNWFALGTRILSAFSLVLALMLVLKVFLLGETVFATGLLCLLAVTVWVFSSQRFYVFRYVFPSVATVVLFIFLPLVLTGLIAFTNYSGAHLLSFERAKASILATTQLSSEEEFSFTLGFDGENNYRLRLTDASGQAWVTDSFQLPVSAPLAVGVQRHQEDENWQVLPRRVIGKNRQSLKRITVHFVGQNSELQSSLSTDQVQQLRMASFRSFSPLINQYRAEGEAGVYDLVGDRYFQANFATGYFENPENPQEHLVPGFYVPIGFDNFTNTLSDPGVRGPFLSIFIWTVAFSSLTVLFTLVVGLVLASLLNWRDLPNRGLYRVLLILPYAIPAFISILVFRGLFNQNFGEINLVLEQLLGVRPDWFSDPFLAKLMILIVNTWLGYPYILILCLGLLKTIPNDLYEATAMEGANFVQNFFYITVPMVMRPLAPLLVASFAFNFNNFVLITLLTQGGPDMLNATVGAGHTDLLASFAYRTAFVEGGKSYGLASAISILIFLLVSAIALINLKLARIEDR